MPGLALASLRGDLSFPSAWEEKGCVEQLYIYPVKSMGLVPVTEFHTGKFGAEAGLMVDRQFCVVDCNGKFISARRYPTMVLIKPSLATTSGWLTTHHNLTLSFDGSPDLTLPLPTGDHPSKSITIWGDTAEGIDMGDAAGAWLSTVILGREDGGLRLIFHKEKSSTRPNKNPNEYFRPLEQPDDKPFYADGYGYLLLSKSSIEGLNKRLAGEGKDLVVEQTRFRPNIFVRGDFEAFNEDTWSFIKIGEAVFRNIKLCTRCVFTTVDPETGVKNPDGEPLKILRAFRSTEDETEKKEYGTTPFFGINLGIHTGGKIKVGDKVYIGKK